MRAFMTLALLLWGCDPEKGPAGEEGLLREDLGSLTTDDEGSVAVAFTVPDDAVSTLLWCGPYGWDALATAETITAPDGSTIFDLEDEGATAMRVGVHGDLLPALFPVSPDLDIQAGAYSFGLYVQADAYPVSVTCGTVHRVQAVEDTATVDLHIVLVGVDDLVDGFDAVGAPDVLGPSLDVMAELWSAAGVEIGDITYDDFDGDVATYESVDGDEELGDLLRTVATPGDRSITFFMVESITDEDGATILGLAGGPPGTAALGGTSKSGVVVSAASAVDDADLTGRIMAHEGGHFLGLFHTTEKDGTQTDPLSDTPECAISADADNSNSLSSDECEGKGPENLMWWSANSDARGVSDDQAWVLKRSPAAH